MNASQWETLRRCARGDLRITWATDRNNDESDAGILSFTRTYKGKIALVVTNVSDSKTSETGFGSAAMAVPFPVGTKLVEVLADPYDMTKETKYTVPSDGTLRILVLTLLAYVAKPPRFLVTEEPENGCGEEPATDRKLLPLNVLANGCGS